MSKALAFWKNLEKKSSPAVSPRFRKGIRKEKPSKKPSSSTEDTDSREDTQKVEEKDTHSSDAGKGIETDSGNVSTPHGRDINLKVSEKREKKSEGGNPGKLLKTTDKSQKQVQLEKGLETSFSDKDPDVNSKTISNESPEGEGVDNTTQAAVKNPGELKGNTRIEAAKTESTKDPLMPPKIEENTQIDTINKVEQKSYPTAEQKEEGKETNVMEIEMTNAIIEVPPKYFGFNIESCTDCMRRFNKQAPLFGKVWGDMIGDLVLTGYCAFHRRMLMKKKKKEGSKKPEDDGGLELQEASRFCENGCGFGGCHEAVMAHVATPGECKEEKTAVKELEEILRGARMLQYDPEMLYKAGVRPRRIGKIDMDILRKVLTTTCGVKPGHASRLCRMFGTDDAKQTSALHELDALVAFIIEKKRVLIIPTSGSMARSVVDWAHLNILELHPNLVQLGGDDEEKAAPFATEMNSNFEALKGFWKTDVGKKLLKEGSDHKEPVAGYFALFAMYLAYQGAPMFESLISERLLKKGEGLLEPSTYAFDPSEAILEAARKHASNHPSRVKAEKEWNDAKNAEFIRKMDQRKKKTPSSSSSNSTKDNEKKKEAKKVDPEAAKAAAKEAMDELDKLLASLEEDVNNNNSNNEAIPVKKQSAEMDEIDELLAGL